VRNKGWGLMKIFGNKEVQASNERDDAPREVSGGKTKLS
jgi:hypothetical protein